MEYEVSGYPKWIEENVRKITMKFTDEMLSLVLDISIYLGEVVIRNYPQLYWGHFARSYREFLLSYKMPGDIIVLVSFSGDSFACSWSKTFSREKNGDIPRPEGAGVEWDSKSEFNVSLS